MSSNVKPSRRFTTGNRWRASRASWAWPKEGSHNWRRQAVETISDAEKEVIAIRKKLREVEMERDILKKAALIFGRSG